MKKKQRTMQYVIEADPIPWKRAGVSGSKGRLKFYDQQEHNKMAVGLILHKQHQDQPIFDKPITIDLEFYFTLPKTSPDMKHHAIKPDIDNLSKFILDAIQDVLITDDKIIVSLNALKKYGPKSQTLITITEL